MRMPHALTFGIAILVFSSHLACSQDGAADGGRGGNRPNVLLVTFDTTRADHIGAYGWKHTFTPTLDKLAEKAIKFNRAYSAVPLTMPSHTSIMTGLYPFYHGVRNNSHFVLNQKVRTLAEALKENGYQTGAVVAAFVLDSRFGLDQGFDTYDDEVSPASESTVFAVPERRASQVTDASLSWLNSIDDGAPFFLWAHYYDPHAVYDAPDSYTHFSGHPYDKEISYADSELARLLKAVHDRTNDKRQTLIVFAADHGEALGQHGEATHAYFAYDSTLHVPMLVRLPDGSHAGEEIDCPVSLVDLMPTVLDVVGVPVPAADEIHGRTLMPLIESPETAEAYLERPLAFECYESYYSYGWAPLQGIRVGDTKFIDLPKPELYVLPKGAQENPDANHYEDMPKLAATMRVAYQDLFGGLLSFPPYTLQPQMPDPDVVEKLRALGYVSSEVAEEPQQRGPREDLKDMLPTYARVLRAMSAMSSARYDFAADELLDLLHEEPENRRVFWLLAELVATKSTVKDEAITTIETILREGKVEPSMVPQTLTNCGRACWIRNKNERALKYFSEAVASKEDYPAAHQWLGLTNLRLGNHADAIAALKKAADQYGPKLAYPRVYLGWAYFVDGQSENGVREWANVLKEAKAGKAGRKRDAIWDLVDTCPFDFEIGAEVAPLLRRYVSDESLPGRVRAALAALCSDYLLVTQNPEQALAILEKTLPFFAEDDPRLLLKLGELNRCLGRTEKARGLLERACRVAPDQVDVAGALARVLEQAGQIDTAVDVLDRFLKEQGASGAALNNLAYMLARQGKDLHRALKLAKRVVQRLPDDADAADTLGWIYHLLGDKEMAMAYATRAATINPESAEFHYHLGEIHRAAGRTEAAKAAFQKAVELAPMPRPYWYQTAEQGSR